jgi:hypothetical protein
MVAHPKLSVGAETQAARVTDNYSRSVVCARA